MEEDEEHQSLQSPANFISLAPPSSSPLPILPKDDVTVAAVIKKPSESPADFLSLAPPPSSSPLLISSPDDGTVAAVVKKLSEESPVDFLSLAPPSSSPPLISPSEESPSRNALSLADHTPFSGGGNERRGRRDENWSEEATNVLIDAWGNQVSKRGGNGNLNQQDWKEVAQIVNNSGLCNTPKSGTQCKKRIYLVKIKYKQIKALIASGIESSSLTRLDSLIGNVNNNI